ncbi:MAG TPA: ABC transporter permease [Chloroflexota bacterium]|nr:ABC transporter permease [Chloroflexota bacterium]
MEVDTRQPGPAIAAGEVAADAAVLAASAERRTWRDLRRNNLFLGLVSLVVVVTVWETLSNLEIVNPMFFSSPSQIVVSFVKLFVITGDIWPHLWASAQTGFLGILLAVVIGIPVGAAIGRYHTMRGLLEPYVVAMYSTPRVAFIPLIILVLGIGLLPKVVLVFLSAVFPILVNTQVGVEQADHGLIELGRSCRASERQIFQKIILPCALPYVTAGFRLAIGRALITIVVAELFASNVGIGYFISRMSAQFRTADMFVGILTLTFAGVMLSMSVRWLEQRMAPWLNRGLE